MAKEKGIEDYKKRSKRIHRRYAIMDFIASWLYEFIYGTFIVIVMIVELVRLDSYSFHFDNLNLFFGLFELLIPLFISTVSGLNNGKIYGLSYKEFRKIPEANAYGIVRMYITSFVFIILIFLFGWLGLMLSLSFIVGASIVYIPQIIYREVPLYRRSEKRLNKIIAKILHRLSKYEYRYNLNLSESKIIVIENLIYNGDSSRTLYDILQMGKQKDKDIDFKNLYHNLVLLMSQYTKDFYNSNFLVPIEDVNSIIFKDVNLSIALQTNLAVANEILSSDKLAEFVKGDSHSSELISDLIIYTRRDLEILQIASDKESAFIHLIDVLMENLHSSGSLNFLILTYLSLSAINDYSTWFCKDINEAYLNQKIHNDESTYFYVYNAIFYDIVNEVCLKSGIAYKCIDTSLYDGWYSFVDPIFRGKSREWCCKFLAFALTYHGISIQLLQNYILDEKIISDQTIFEDYGDNFISDWWYKHVSQQYCL